MGSKPAPCSSGSPTPARATGSRPARSASPVRPFRTLPGIAATDDRPDAELAAAAQSGDRGALDALLRRHHDRLYALCRRLCGNDADAADATQEALLAIVKGLHHFDGRAAFSTWSYRVATNACLDELRRRKRRPVPVGDDRPEPVAGGDPANQAAARIDVDRALAGLPLEFRTAVVLRDLCALDYSEIADVLDIPIGTVRSRIARGRSAIVDALGGNGEGGNSGSDPRRPTPTT